jgi:hypothetical protein
MIPVLQDHKDWGAKAEVKTREAAEAAQRLELGGG